MINIYDADGKTFAMRITSKLTKEDYQTIVPQIEQRIEQFGPINLLIQIENFKSIEPAALWEDIKFDIKHRDDFEQIAIVGDKEWINWSARFSQIFYNARIKYFESNQLTRAWEWLGVSEQVKQF